MDPMIVAPDVEAMLYQLFAAARQLKLAVCGLFPAGIAQARLAEIEALAVAQQHPLRCIVELP